MGLKGDIEEAKELWEKGSLSLKIFVVVSLVITTSSITSLADVVFQWKGFILNGIEFYRSTIGVPFSTVKKYFNLNYSQSNIDIITLFTLMMGSIIRCEWLDFKHNKGKLNLIIITSACSFFILAIMWFFLVFYREMSSIEYLIGFFFIFNSFTIFIVFPIVFKYSYKRKIILWGPALFAISTTLILSAINAGLTRV